MSAAPKLASVLLCGVAAAFAGSPRITFTKSFPASNPAYEFVSVDRTGLLTYRESATDSQPLTATLQNDDTEALFALVQKLNYFHDPLESGLKVANTGKKTFRYEDEQGAPTEAVFNYSLNPAAQQLLERLELIAMSERALLDLDRAARYDKLGVNDALAEIESLWLRKQLAAPAQFIPLLNRIASHETYMHMARDRAAKLRDEFQSATASAAARQQ